MFYGFVAHVGGSFNNGTNCGFFYWNFNNGSGDNNWNIGARLLIIKIYCIFSSTALAENWSLWTVLVASLKRKVGRLIRKIYRMKRVGNIYSKIIDKNNLLYAIQKASKGKSKRRNIKNIKAYLIENVNYLHEILKNETFKPTRGQIMIIHDGVRKKERTIEKPRFFPDQCVHWALMLQIMDILMKGMIDTSCASIPGRGGHYMKKHIEKILIQDRKYTKYCLVIDIKKFYQSIDTEILKYMFRRIIKDRQTLILIDKIIDSSDHGLPIGNFTSQWFANFYLQKFDHWIKEEKKIKYYFRYMDDMIFFSNNKKQLHKLRIEIEQYLKKINLLIKDNWQVFKVDSRPIVFCGFKYYRGYTTLKSSNALRIKRRVNKISKKKILVTKDAAAVISFWGQLKNTNSYKYYEKNIKNKVNIKVCKEVISNANRKQ